MHLNHWGRYKDWSNSLRIRTTGEDTRIGLIAYAFEPLIARADLDSSESESESDQERADDT